MKHVGDYLKREMTTNGISQKQVAEAIGTTPQRMSQLLSAPDMRISMYNKICQNFRLDPLGYFDWALPSQSLFSHAFAGSQNNGDHWTINAGDGESTVRVLTQMLADKERMLADKNKIISLLEKQLENRVNSVSANIENK